MLFNTTKTGRSRQVLADEEAVNSYLQLNSVIELWESC